MYSISPPSFSPHPHSTGNVTWRYRCCTDARFAQKPFRLGTHMRTARCIYWPQPGAAHVCRSMPLNCCGQPDRAPFCVAPAAKMMLSDCPAPTRIQAIIDDRHQFNVVSKASGRSTCSALLSLSLSRLCASYSVILLPSCIFTSVCSVERAEIGASYRAMPRRRSSEVPVGGAGPAMKVPAEVGRSRDGNCDAMGKL